MERVVGGRKRSEEIILGMFESGEILVKGEVSMDVFDVIGRDFAPIVTDAVGDEDLATGC